MHEELLHLIREKGLLLEREIFDLLGSFGDLQSAKEFLEGIARFSGQKMITKSILHDNSSFLQHVVAKLQGKDKTTLENVFVTLGIHLEIRKEAEVAKPSSLSPLPSSYRIFTADTKTDKKITVSDFTGNFRARYHQLQRMLMQRPDLTNLMSISKISSNRQQLSIIGMVREKRITKNKHVILVLEDLTGEIQALLRADKPELAILAGEIQLDDVLAVKASGNRDMLFIHDIFFDSS